MLLLNGELFIPTSSSSEHELQRNHYEESIAFIRKEYSQDGRVHMVTLVRRKEPKRNATGALEETPPLIFPAKAYPEIQLSRKDKNKKNTIGGIESWAYSKHRAIRKTAKDDYGPDPKSIPFMSHSESYDMNTQMDLIYFLLYKSPKVYFLPAIGQGKVKKGDLMVYDPARIAKEKVTKEREALKLKNAIMAPDVSFPLHNDDNLRKVAAAWGLDGAMDKYQSADDLRIRLEHKVNEGEKDKKKRTDGSGKGIAEFLEMIDFDDSVRQRAMMMYALDNDVIKFDKNKYIYIENGGTVVEVPDKHRYTSFDFLAEHLKNELHAKDWELFKGEVISESYLDSLKYDDLKWLAKQDDIAISSKTGEALREEISKIYCA